MRKGYLGLPWSGKMSGKMLTAVPTTARQTHDVSFPSLLLFRSKEVRSQVLASSKYAFWFYLRYPVGLTDNMIASYLVHRIR
jgi:hypothetical protein